MFLRFEVLDSGCLGEVDLCPLHRGFPLQPFLPCRLQAGQSFAFGGLASKSYFLHDFGELVLKGA
ncbi:hypothetical protein [Streptomyces sp. NPDC054787]